jgi:hypothetical protein
MRTGRGAVADAPTMTNGTAPGVQPKRRTPVPTQPPPAPCTDNQVRDVRRQDLEFEYRRLMTSLLVERYRPTPRIRPDGGQLDRGKSGGAE